MLDLVPDVTVVVHPVDTAIHPSYPEGWRWAVQVGGRPPADVEHCVQAGHCPTQAEATFYGEQCGSAVAKAMRLFGIPARYGVLALGYDPIPAEADDRPLAVWRGEDR